jgi:hypothetical protein
MDVHGRVYTHVVAWQSLFLLQCRETNEVLLPGSYLQENLQKQNPEWRQMM